jgi:hypothetical protein
MDEDIDEQELLEDLASGADERWPVFEEVLGEMTPIYHEDAEWLDIIRANISHAKPGGEEIGVQPDLPMEMEPEVTGPDILRLLDDLTAHEVEHVNASDLEAKQRFMEQYPNFGKLAGHVYNIFEDEYIDMRRKRRFFGMRSKLAYYVWLHMNTEQRAPDVGEVEENEGLPNALMAGLLQVALAGYMNGDPSDTVKDAMARMEPLLDRVRECDDVDRREVICHGAIQVLLRYIPDPDEYNGDEMDDRKRATGGDPREADDEAPETFDGEPEVEMDDEMKEAVEELLEDLMDDDEVPDPVPDGEVEVVESPEEVDVEPPDTAGEPEFDESDFEDALDDAESLEDALDEGDEDERDDETIDKPMDGLGEGGDGEESEDGGDESMDVESESVDPLGDDAGSPEMGEGESESMPGDGEGGSEGSEPDRDIEQLLDEYGPDSLTVTN